MHGIPRTCLVYPYSSILPLRTERAADLIHMVGTGTSYELFNLLMYTTVCTSCCVPLYTPGTFHFSVVFVTFWFSFRHKSEPKKRKSRLSFISLGNEEGSQTNAGRMRVKHKSFHKKSRWCTSTDSCDAPSPEQKREVCPHGY